MYALYPVSSSFCEYFTVILKINEIDSYERSHMLILHLFIVYSFDTIIVCINQEILH